MTKAICAWDRDAINGYIECAEWVGNICLSDEERADAEASVLDFLENEEVADAIIRLIAEFDVDGSQVGHDFFLTRNGHGAGFWDRGYGALGTELTRLSKVWGETYYEGDGSDLDEDEQARAEAFDAEFSDSLDANSDYGEDD